MGPPSWRRILKVDNKKKFIDTHPLAQEKQTNIPPIDPCRSVCRTDGLNVLTHTKGLELQPAMRPARRQTDYNKTFTCCVLMCYSLVNLIHWQPSSWHWSWKKSIKFNVTNSKERSSVKLYVIFHQVICLILGTALNTLANFRIRHDQNLQKNIW